MVCVDAAGNLWIAMWGAVCYFNLITVVIDAAKLNCRLPILPVVVLGGRAHHPVYYELTSCVDCHGKENAATCR